MEEAAVPDPAEHGEMLVAYGLAGQRLSDYELDHVVPLELGGSPADVANLWPESWSTEPSAHEKDAVEDFLRRQVCRGLIALVDAQRQIATNWVAVYQQNALRPR